MRIISTLLTTLVALVFFTSCQKGLDYTLGTDSTVSSYLVRTYNETVVSSTVGNSSTTYNLGYDASNRLISLISTTDPGDKLTWKYNSNNTITGDIYSAGALSIHEIYYINSLSLLDSTLQYNDTNDTTTEKYLYNSSKQLITQKEYIYQSSIPTLNNTYFYTYDNAGNTIKETDNNSVTTYTYTGNILNTVNLGTGLLQQNLGKYLPVSLTYTESGVTSTATHTYTFDTKNRISMDKEVLNTGDVETKTYTY